MTSLMQMVLYIVLIKRDLKAKIYIKEYAGLKKVIQERQALIQAFIRTFL